MKVPGSIRAIYSTQRVVCADLKSEVDTLIKTAIDSRWHYESRLKEETSFAMKIESGRFHDPSRLEDFFACTIVVKNAGDLQRAIELIESKFSVKGKRPPDPKRTHKEPSSFVFDDLRYYCTINRSDALPPKPYDDVIFEVQIKTFLQHAWSIATHDMIYKADAPSWAQARIAFQIKAMLEHSELSILEAGQLSKSPHLAKQDKKTRDLAALVKIFSVEWDTSSLPRDMIRLSENTLSLLQLFEISIAAFKKLLSDKRKENGGSHPLNLSPYSSALQYLISEHEAKFASVIRTPGLKTKVLIPAEVELPSGIDASSAPGAIILPETSEQAP